MSKVKVKENNRKGEGNMENLIEVKEENGELLVSGRDLYKALEIGTPYKKWFDRMVAYGFSENIDFLVMDIFVHNSKGGKQSKTDHILKLDMAKELCMIQRNPIGKKFRQYFIEVEKRYRNQVPQLSEETKALIDIIEAEDKLSQALSIRRYREIVERPLLETIEEQKPKVEYTDSVLSSEGTMPLREIVKCFKNLSSQKANRILVEHNIIYRQKRADGKLGKVIPRQETQNKGYMKQSTRIDSLGKTHQEYKWTELGKNFLVEFFQELGFVLIEK